MKTDEFNVTYEEEGERLDNFLTNRSGFTRSHIQKLIKVGLVLVNAKKEKSGYRIREGDRVDMSILDQPEGELLPEDIPLNIVYEDDYLIVVNKPPGMVVYPATGNTQGTMMNAVVFRYQKLSSVGAPLRPGVVHRLDKDTSGLIVIARTDDAYYSLNDQFREREVEKHYIALLYGVLKNNKGEISIPIGRSFSDRKKMSVKSKNRKEAITEYEVLRRFRTATLARIRIITGRTHQIRVHFASQGHPVLGDRTYGGKASLKTGRGIIRFGRQMLHAGSIKIKHPATGEPLLLEAPLPDDIEKAIEELGQQ